MLYLTCTMISSVDHAHYGVSHAKDLVYVDCGRITVIILTVKHQKADQKSLQTFKTCFVPAISY